MSDQHKPRRLPVLSVRWLEHTADSPHATVHAVPAVATASTPAPVVMGSGSIGARGEIPVAGHVRRQRPGWDPLAGDGLVTLVAGVAYGVATDSWHWPAGQALALAVLVYLWLGWLLAQRPER